MTTVSWERADAVVGPLSAKYGIAAWSERLGDPSARRALVATPIPYTCQIALWAPEQNGPRWSAGVFRPGGTFRVDVVLHTAALSDQEPDTVARAIAAAVLAWEE